jgi:hypothetical protein
VPRCQNASSCSGNSASASPSAWLFASGNCTARPAQGT